VSMANLFVAASVLTLFGLQQLVKWLTGKEWAGNLAVIFVVMALIVLLSLAILFTPNAY